jgi:hypothetical protein
MRKRIIRIDKTVTNLKRNRIKGLPVIKYDVPQPGITKKEFMDVLTKAVPPVEHEAQSDSGNSET